MALIKDMQIDLKLNVDDSELRAALDRYRNAMNDNSKKLPDEMLPIKLVEGLDSPVISALVDRLSSQTRKGIEKYGSVVQPGDLEISQWIEHLQDELTDALVYLECIKQSLRSSDGNQENGSSSIGK